MWSSWCTCPICCFFHVIFMDHKTQALCIASHHRNRWATVPATLRSQCRRLLSEPSNGSGRISRSERRTQSVRTKSGKWRSGTGFCFFLSHRPRNYRALRFSEPRCFWIGVVVHRKEVVVSEVVAIRWWFKLVAESTRAHHPARPLPVFRANR